MRIQNKSTDFFVEPRPWLKSIQGQDLGLVFGDDHHHIGNLDGKQNLFATCCNPQKTDG